MYKEVFIKSWKDLKNNLIIFVPSIIILLVNILLGFLFLKYSGLLKLLTDPDVILKELETAVPIIKLYFKENILRIIISLTLFVLTSFIIGSSLTAMKLGMMKDLVNKRKLTIKKMIRSGNYVWQVISMKIIVFFIGVIIFLFILGTGIILSTFLQKIIVILIMGILSPLVIIALQLLLFFRYPVMFLENKNPITAIKNSFDYFLQNKKYVFIIGLIIFAVSFVTAPLSTYLGVTKEKMIFFSATVMIGYLLKSIINIIIEVWSQMFKFRSYKVRPLKP